jgi:hypothetical protein
MIAVTDEVTVEAQSVLGIPKKVYILAAKTLSSTPKKVKHFPNHLMMILAVLEKEKCASISHEN